MDRYCTSADDAGSPRMPRPVLFATASPHGRYPYLLASGIVLDVMTAQDWRELHWDDPRTMKSRSQQNDGSSP